MEVGAALLRGDWLGCRWLEGWKIRIKLPCGRFPQAVWLNQVTHVQLSEDAGSFESLGMYKHLQ
jgi:hypothetical protein